MSLTIDEKHRLLQDGKLVKRIMSPYTGGKLPKKPGITVIHFTYGASAASSANWFSDPTNTERTSAHVVVGRDGELIQCVDFDTVAHHAGRSFWRGGTGLNTWSFGVELANWGYLKEQGNAWVSWTGRVVPNAVLAVHRNGNPDNFQGNLGWEP